MKISSQLIVKNEMGLHARPATQIVKLLLTCQSEVTFIHGMMKINAKNILSILMLAATKDTILTVEVCGEDAAETLEKLRCAFEEKFGE
ncbi:MAG: HPr family phosphocarrier protein [Parachlamydiaceae bacterium]